MTYGTPGPEKADSEALARIVEHCASEREALARSLHNCAGQSIAAASMALSLLERDTTLGAAAAALVRKAKHLLSESSSQMRLLQYQLYPPLLREFGLIDCLRTFAHELAAAKSVQIEIAESGSLNGSHGAISEWIYRMAQVALNYAADLSPAVAIIRDFGSLVGGSAKIDPDGRLSMRIPCEKVDSQ